MVIVKLPDLLSFEWDRGNEQKNWIKHRVTAEEAEEPFFTDDYLILEDESHSSEQEDRYILLGKNRQEKADFWDKIDITEYFEPEDFKRVVFPNLKRTNKPISIRLPEPLIEEAKEKAQKLDVPIKS